MYEVLRREAQDIRQFYQKPNTFNVGRFFVLSTLCWRRPTLPYMSTIGSGRLNCRVRNENGCDPSDKAPTQKAQDLLFAETSAQGGSALGRKNDTLRSKRK